MLDFNKTFPVTVVELSYKQKVRPSERPWINGSKDAYDLFMRCWNSKTLDLIEESKAILLNTSSKVLALYEVSKGGVNSTVIDPRLLFIAALKINASGIILAHNHPSGHIKPSQRDVILTEKLTNAGYLLEIELLDHLIISSEGFYSFQSNKVFICK